MANETVAIYNDGVSTAERGIAATESYVQMRSNRLWEMGESFPKDVEDRKAVESLQLKNVKKILIERGRAEYFSEEFEEKFKIIKRPVAVRKAQLFDGSTASRKVV